MNSLLPNSPLKSNMNAVRPGQEHSMLTMEQQRLIQALRKLFDPYTEEGGNPLAKLGALMSDQDTFRHFQTPLNALGLTMGDKYLADGANDVEINMLRESEVSPIEARGKILLGPQAMSGERTDVVPHELMHKAMGHLDPEGHYGGIIEELMIRRAMEQENNEAAGNAEYYDQHTVNPKLSREASELFLNDYYAKARKELPKYLKRRPTQ